MVKLCKSVSTNQGEILAIFYDNYIFATVCSSAVANEEGYSARRALDTLNDEMQPSRTIKAKGDHPVATGSTPTNLMNWITGSENRPQRRRAENGREEDRRDGRGCRRRAETEQKALRRPLCCGVNAVD